MRDDHPIVVGICGEAATGKTVTGKGFCPTGYGSDQVLHQILDAYKEEESEPKHKIPYIEWSHLFFALPLYRMVAARQKILGEYAEDRTLYELHETLIDLFGRSPLYSAIKSYDDLVELVHYVAGTYCEPPETKARTFMQKMGSLCREYDKDVFVKWMMRKVTEEFRLMRQGREDVSHRLCGIILSDVRHLNEAEWIFNQPNGALIKLVARPEVRLWRQLDRDGKSLNEEQANHESEKSVDLIPAEWLTATVDTSDMSVEEQVFYIRNLINKTYGLS